MANIKITELTAYGNPTSTDVLPIVDVGADVTKKVSVADLLENAGSGTAAAPGIAFDGDSDTGIYRPGANQLVLSTNGTGRLFVDSSGSVGVGTSTPAAILHSVATSTGAVSETLRLQNLSDGLNAGTEIMLASNNVPHVKIQQLVTGTTAGNRGSDCLFFTKADGGSISERLRITSAGLVGIGTGSPAKLVHISGNQPEVFVQQQTYIPGAAGFRASAAGADTPSNASYYQMNGGCIWGQTDGLGIRFGPDDRSAVSMLINTNNNRVGIGTTNPGVALDVNGDARADGLYGYGDTNTGIEFPGSDVIVFKEGGTERARIDSSGRLIIGESSGSARLNVFDGSFSNTDINSDIALLRLSDKNSRYNGTETLVGNFQSGIQFDAVQLNGASRYGSFIKQVVTSNNFTGGTPKMRTDLIFGTRGDSESSPSDPPVERLRIDSVGHLLVGMSSSSGGALLQVNGNRIRVTTAKTPASASDTGTTGEICWDASYIYVCTATNTWKRAALSTW